MVRAAAEAAAAVTTDDLVVVAMAAADGAQAALARTPDQLEALRRAGVVDAGGRGAVVLLDALVAVVTGVEPRARPRPAHLPVPTFAQGEVVDPGGPSYEVMYLLDAPVGPIAALRETLGTLGDSLLVVGGDGLWNVHVHVDDVGAAIEAGIAAGRPYRIAVTHFRDQVARHGDVPVRPDVWSRSHRAKAWRRSREVGAGWSQRRSVRRAGDRRRAARDRAAPAARGRRPARRPGRCRRGRRGSRLTPAKTGVAGRGHPDPRAGPGACGPRRPRPGRRSTTTWSR